MSEFASHLWTIYAQHTNSNLRAILGALGIFLFFLILRKIFANLIIRIASLSKSEVLDHSIRSFELPLRYLFILIGAYMALIYLPLNPFQDVFINKIFRSGVIILITWGIYHLVGTNSVFSDEAKEKLKFDNILIALFSKLIRFLIVALAVVLVAHEWNYDVNGFVAGLGLGGLAFALAAKDVLANIFGGIVIIMEKPFSIGDWIFTNSVEGTVEDISFRSTRIRTFTQALVTVPNSTLANEAITNWSKMGKRRVSFYISLNYNTPVVQVEKALQKITAFLNDQTEIHQDTIRVALENLKESSLEILVQYFTITTDSIEHLKIKETINLRLLQILQEEDIFVGLIGIPPRPVPTDKG